MFAWARDPSLDKRASVWTFGVATGLAIMTKSLAGILPLLVLLLCCALPESHRRRDPHARKPAPECNALAASALVLGGYVLTEMLAWGTAAPGQTTSESAVVFYGRRLIETAVGL